MTTQPLNRRTFLKGVGTVMALPMLEAMRPGTLYGAPVVEKTPIRMSFVFFPNGAIMGDWKPSSNGDTLRLSKTLTPLAKHQKDLLVFSGLTQHHGRANGDGPGDHARNASSYLTGAQPFKTSGANIRVGVSVDQIAAQDYGDQTKLPSLELGVERGRNAGNCDSGYSCAYSSNISWKTPSTPMAKEINPKLAFERLFGSNQEDAKHQQQRLLYRKSILDLVAADAAQLHKQLGKADQRKLDEYFTSVRELELRISRAATKQAEVPEYDVPQGIPRQLKEHIRLMYDLQVLAFQTDTTRVSTFMVANAGSNRSYSDVNVREGHHHLSHHRNDKGMMAKIQKVDQFLVSQFAYFLDKLAAVKEGEKRLLDSCLVVYGSAIADGNRHHHHDLPIVLAGNAQGAFKTNRYLQYDENTPLNNLFLSMLHEAGAKVDSFGDSTGFLPRLKG